MHTNAMLRRSDDLIVSVSLSDAGRGEERLGGRVPRLGGPGKHCALVLLLYPFSVAQPSFVLCSQVYAANQYSAPLEPTQIPSVRRVLSSLPSTFPEDRIRNMASAINGML